MKFLIGQQVYFHNYLNSKEKSINFLCEGIITRCPIINPKQPSNVFKVHIIAVNPNSLLIGNRPELAIQLLNKVIPKSERNLYTTIGALGKTFYGLRDDVHKTQWLHISTVERSKLNKKINKNK